ncbi:alpha/beta hydrolase family protein [Amycolatopsis anabasis]|uniref:alpha/beta hydrolase family protein n=1 Tax=Amycolatopsis anabasis TaxID=1840409 RepID=UPI00131A9C78|nr:alpha/beta hydrolase [Amycolatopsis anabasis]
MTTKFVRSALATVCAGLVFTAVAAPATIAAESPPTVEHTAPGRGALVAIEAVATLGKKTLAAYLTDRGLTTPSPDQGVHAYRLIYRTVGPDGAATTASGLLVVPHNDNRVLQVVSYQHGTNSLKDGAATVSDDRIDRAIAMFFAGAGYAAVAPDFLGLGYGAGPHPYLDVTSETTASVDMLRAARTALASLGRTTRPDVLVTGFSQGGRTSMALGRALAEGADPDFRLGALAPVSGPFDLLGTQLPAALDGRLEPHAAAFYLAYFTVAWNRLHHLYDTPAEAFATPHVEPLFDGTHDDQEIVRQLPAPHDLLTPRFAERLRHPTGPLADALRTGDSTCSWHPPAPIRIYASPADQEVPITNSEHCRDTLHTHGANPQLTILGEADHRTTPIAALPDILRFFHTTTRSTPPSDGSQN